MRNLITISCLAVAVLTVACSKENQELVSGLVGEKWTVTDIQVNGKSVDINEFVGDGSTTFYYTYNDCEVKDGSCSGSFYYNEIDDSTGVLTDKVRTFTYEISGKQETYTETRVLEADGDFCASNCTTEFEIIRYKEGKIFCYEGPNDDGDLILWTMKPE